MKKILGVVLGIILVLCGCMLTLAVFFSKTNIIKNISNLIKGPELDFHQYDYTYYSTGLALNIIILIVSFYLFKKGRQLILKK